MYTTFLAECESSSDLEDKSPEICLAISASLTSIVSGALSLFLIGADESRVCLLPGAQHEELYTARVLDEIGKSIQRDPENFDVFISVLVREGAPIDNFAITLSK